MTVELCLINLFYVKYTYNFSAKKYFCLIYICKSEKKRKTRLKRVLTQQNYERLKLFIHN
jgi:hypothetical protein